MVLLLGTSLCLFSQVALLPLQALVTAASIASALILALRLHLLSWQSSSELIMKRPLCLKCLHVFVSPMFVLLYNQSPRSPMLIMLPLFNNASAFVGSTTST